MFIRKELEKVINEKLYKEFLPTCPKKVDLQKLLPFKEILNPITVSVIIECISDMEEYDSNMESLLQDYIESIIYDSDYTKITPKSTVGMSSCITMFSKAKRVENALQEASLKIHEVARILMTVDEGACAVGGCVRDAILGVEPKDWDFVSSKGYDELRVEFEARGYKVDETGKQFLVLIVSKDGEQFEIAMFRKDGMYEDGRRPEAVEAGTIFDDSQRRDFTVNALYYRLKDMVLLDPTGRGIRDICDRVLRFVGNPKDRLSEDSIRAYRFYRFTTKGFTPDSKSLKAVRDKIQQESMMLQNLKELVKLDGVKEIVDKETSKRQTTKLVKPNTSMSMTYEELLKPISNIERVRLELEKMAGI